MFNSAFTDEILQYLARRHTVKTDDLYRTLHHELIPMLIALLPKLDHIIHKHDPSFLWLHHVAFEDLQVTELPYLRTLEIDHDIFGILDRAPHLAQVDFLNPPSYTHSWIAIESFGAESEIKTLRLQDILSSPQLDASLSFAAKDLRSLVIEACTKSFRRIHQPPWYLFSVDTIDKVRNYRHSLEILHLDLRDVNERRPFYRPSSTSHDFEQLHHLLLSTRLIFGISRERKVEDRYAITHILPPSIVSLHLVWDDTEIDRFEEGLLGLADAATNGFQNLKSVGLDYAKRLDATVIEAMVRAGIEFTYESWPLSFTDEPGDSW